MSDWYSIAIERNQGDADCYLASERSQSWAGPLPPKGPARLAYILKHCRNMARNIGLPANCQINWAVIGKAAGRAGFSDAPKAFNQPFIHLCQGIIHGECPEEQMLDCYLGVALHEGSHIVNTRLGYARKNGKNNMDKVAEIFQNLWLDEHVEQYIRNEAPGYRCYIHAAKQQLLRPVLSAIDWEVLPDLDRVNLVTFALIRTPDLVKPHWKEFETLKGACVFQEFDIRVAANDAMNEQDYLDAHQSILRFWYDCSCEYSSHWKQLLLMKNTVSEAILGLMLHQRYCDEVDKIILKYGNEYQSVARELLELGGRLEKIGAPLARDWLWKWLCDKADETLLLAANIEESKNVMFGRQDKRFGLPELVGINDRNTNAQMPISAEDSRSVQELLAIEESDGWPTRIQPHIDERNKRRVLVIQPDPKSRDIERYHESVKRIQNAIRAGRAILPSVKTLHEARTEQQKTGCIDRRRLWSARHDDRVFFQRNDNPRRKKEHSIGLLLDESGSMTWGARTRLEEIKRQLARLTNGDSSQHLSKAERARDIAVWLAEVLGSQSNIELDIWSHTSDTHDDCVVKHLYGKNQPDPRIIGCYDPGNENYDALAIQTSANLLLGKTTHKQKTLLVVSDGQPSEGRRGLQSAKEAVTRARKRGINVIGIAIEDFAAQEIYGAAHTLVFDDLEKLFSQLRAMFMRLIR